MGEELVEKLAKDVFEGRLRPYQVEEAVKGDANLATRIRRHAMELATGISLQNIGNNSIDFNLLLAKNIENPIGVAQVPMGIAGPLKINGEYANGTFFVPLCTTEGALVASVNRGCAAITASGGAVSRVIKDGMARAPLFAVPSVVDAKKLVEWVQKNFDKMVNVVQQTTQHGSLIRIDPHIVGNNVFLRFVFSTGDAMGMNMATIACDDIRKLIETECPFADCISLSGNLCVDKKPSAINFLYGRGKSVISEAVIKRDIVQKVLKTTPEDMVEVVVRKNLVGSALAGASYGFNAHFANMIAAVFLATGQDAAQVPESSMGINTAQVLETGDLYFSATLPSLEVGTVGGGSGLPTQKEAMTILGCQGGGNPSGSNAKKFAEIVAAAVLAGELSLIAALSAQHLAEAHKRLGRGSEKKD